MAKDVNWGEMTQEEARLEVATGLGFLSLEGRIVVVCENFVDEDRHELVAQLTSERAIVMEE